MKILVVKDKHSLMMISGDNQPRAFLSLVRFFDDNEYYNEDDMDDHELQWLRSARDGDGVAAEKLATKRKRQHYEYEDEWYWDETVPAQEDGWSKIDLDVQLTSK